MEPTAFCQHSRMSCTEIPVIHLPRFDAQIHFTPSVKKIVDFSIEEKLTTWNGPTYKLVKELETSGKTCFDHTLSLQGTDIKKEVNAEQDEHQILDEEQFLTIFKGLGLYKQCMAGEGSPKGRAEQLLRVQEKEDAYHADTLPTKTYRKGYWTCCLNNCGKNNSSKEVRCASKSCGHLKCDVCLETN